MNIYCAISLYVALILLIVNVVISASDETVVEQEKIQPDDTLSKSDPTPPTKEKLEYAKGSVCGYCHYCEFCELCDKECPCEKSPTKPNCHMCKYCTYCYLCAGVCDTICQPGGVLDKISSAIVKYLPIGPDEKEVAHDLKSVEEWTKASRDEL